MSALVFALVFAIAGCADDGGGDGDKPCDDEGPPTSTSFPDKALLQASLLVEQRAQYAADGTKTESTIINLSLSDFTTYKVDSRFPTPCCASMACFQLSGAPNDGCRGKAGEACGAVTCANNEMCVEGTCVLCARQSLEAEKAVLSGPGVAAGSVELENKGSGKFIKAGLPTPLFAEGSMELAITGRGEAGYFPTSSVSVTAPDVLEVTTPDPKQPASAVSGTDMPIKWKAGNGDRIELTMKSALPSVTDKIVCVARDDGCATIPIGAIEWVKLDMTPGEQISLTLRRIKSAYGGIDSADHAGVLIKATSRVEMLLDQ
ncbi:MAG: hypothetical protein CSB49_04825 [Proteobacteria bacterium]|nr:MAG: hypothetical protein CSB49_04825 [Pseudomonadota bacterium]